MNVMSQFPKYYNSKRIRKDFVTKKPTPITLQVRLMCDYTTETSECFLRL